MGWIHWKLSYSAFNSLWVIFWEGRYYHLINYSYFGTLLRVNLYWFLMDSCWANSEGSAPSKLPLGSSSFWAPWDFQQVDYCAIVSQFSLICAWSVWNGCSHVRVGCLDLRRVSLRNLDWKGNDQQVLS